MGIQVITTYWYVVSAVLARLINDSLSLQVISSWATVVYVRRLWQFLVTLIVCLAAACTCPGESHPGPVMNDGSYVGRSVPEIDVFEALIGPDGGQVCTSFTLLDCIEPYRRCLCQLNGLHIMFALSSDQFGGLCWIYVSGRVRMAEYQQQSGHIQHCKHYAEFVHRRCVQFSSVFV